MLTPNEHWEQNIKFAEGITQERVDAFLNKEKIAQATGDEKNKLVYETGLNLHCARYLITTHLNNFTKKTDLFAYNPKETPESKSRDEIEKIFNSSIKILTECEKSFLIEHPTIQEEELENAMQKMLNRMTYL